MDYPAPLLLLKDLSWWEKILARFISLFFDIVSLAPHIRELINNRFKPNSKSLAPQARKYIENNEIIYASIEKESKNNGFLDACTIPNLFLKSASLYPFTPCMGRREIIQQIIERCPITNKSLVKYEFGNYVWKTYHEVYVEIIRIAKNLIDLDIGKDNKFALFCNTSPEWLMMAYALMFVSCTVVTLFPTLGDESIIRALNETEVKWIMVDEKTLPRLKIILKSVKNIKYIIISKYLESTPNTPEYIIKHSKCFHFDDFVRYESNTDFLSLQPTDTDSLALIVYTSGTSGDPKGVMISHKNILTCLESVSTTKVLLRSSNNEKPHMYAAYLPSSHIFEFVLEILMISLGHSIAFSTPLTLFDSSPMIMKGSRGDIPMIRPSVMIVVPLILERIKRQIIENLKMQSRFKQLIFQCAYNVKMRYRKLGYQTPVIDNLVFKLLRKVFGGNLKFGMIGGAYISRETEEFANICFGEFRQGYGMTEGSSGIASVSYEYMRTGSCGGPISSVEIKLLDWPEGNLYSTDKLCPGGEIAICGDSVALGYYKNIELTDEYFKVDPKTGKRWFHTGDIGIILPDMTLKLIDRKTDIVKLSHGEFVSILKIEGTIIECPLVEMVCVLPNQSKEYLVAIIVPLREKIKKYSEQISVGNLSDDVENLLTIENFRKSLAEQVRSYVVNKLKKYKLPKEFYIVKDTWSPDNNLVTPTMKIKRREIMKKYEYLLE